MDDTTRLNLQKMVKEYGTEETTDKIRKLKHSKLIQNDVQKMLDIKQKYNRMDKNTVKTMAQNQCMFLWKNYTNIFNKLFEDYLDLNILNKFISLLKKVEDGIYDQHEASMMVGQVLKEIYIDSALREDKKKEKLRKKRNKKKKKTNQKELSWREFKAMNMH
tara:strand:+ start:358 stop:843 length:486 start_codon:yes stop_codon:yes gene_type:complete